MNRGLALALIILAFAVTLIGADTILLSEAITESEEALTSCLTDGSPAPEGIGALRRVFEDSRLLFSVSLPVECISEYERSLTALESAAASGNEEAIAAAHADAALALAQIKRSALFSLGQIF